MITTGLLPRVQALGRKHPEWSDENDASYRSQAFFRRLVSIVRKLEGTLALEKDEDYTKHLAAAEFCLVLVGAGTGVLTQCLLNVCTMFALCSMHSPSLTC
jgi:hypothetical protein